MDHAPITAVEVWHALSDELRAFLRSRVPTESDADDLIQNVFVRVMEKIGSLRQADRIESWVYQIARNAIADFYRGRKQPTQALDDAIDPRRNDDIGNQNRTVGGWLTLLIGELPEKLRAAVQMYEIDGLSQSEIANRLNISVSGAKSRVQRGRRQLEQLLRDSCQLEQDRRGNVIGCKPTSVECCGRVSCECNTQS
jgi:RNA polymerase sigma-70 factor, ECF subfamily